jgi:hypothetical protein
VLRDEPRDSDMTIMALLTGPSDINFFQRAKMDGTPIGMMVNADPAHVARHGFDALMRGEQKSSADLCPQR